MNNGKSKDEQAKEILADLKNRQIARRAMDEAWLLNINFLLGNQYTFIATNGEIREQEKLYPYESREVFNHIAPIVESRLAKLNKIRPTIAVRPSSASSEDKEAAKVSKMVLDSEFDRINLPKIIKEATIWSEVTGTSFYKITFTPESGAGVSVVNPFEIFPDSAASESIEECSSIIHARSIERSLAESVYHLDGLVGEDMCSLSLDGLVGAGSGVYVGGVKAKRTAEEVKSDQVLVVERYTKGDGKNPGRLEIVVGGKLVYDGEMPIGEYPFIKQVSNTTLGSFWGSSVIERCIPVQRAYNAVKNRKIEFLSRLSSGVLAVEEGSVDLDILEEEGLAPGKILVYRSGTNSPRFMDGFSVPPEFNREEDRLLNEMNTLAGVSELMRSSVLPSNVTSGTAINQLTEADDTRLSVTAEYIRESLLAIAKLVIKTIKREVSNETISRIFDDKGNVEVLAWKGSDLKSEDVVLDTVNELTESISTRRATAMELFRAGLFSGENGVMDTRAKSKILEILGFGNFESGQDITDLHIARAKRENITDGIPMALEVDDHSIHIQEHTRYLIENQELSDDRVSEMISHIRAHKMFRRT